MLQKCVDRQPPGIDGALETVGEKIPDRVVRLFGEGGDTVLDACNGFSLRGRDAPNLELPGLDLWNENLFATASTLLVG